MVNLARHMSSGASRQYSRIYLYRDVTGQIAEFMDVRNPGA